ncbi:hypothetical protein SAMN05444370_103158 [Rubrimonas cliftonensis]|uniref:Uncharacterized protein n=1 Tax=Rubrimonas cliftonensis TaxID=89524 RepID=A0A1H3YN23_9RHOB|nr:hypothetical protein SAMN05444370_103158 [Rubrimonas cliftonensis]
MRTLMVLAFVVVSGVVVPPADVAPGQYNPCNPKIQTCT